MLAGYIHSNQLIFSRCQFRKKMFKKAVAEYNITQISLKVLEDKIECTLDEFVKLEPPHVFLQDITQCSHTCRIARFGNKE